MANIQFYSILILILNIYHLSNSQYIGLPRDQRRQSAVLKQKIELTCQYTGSDDGEFSSWLKDTENLNQSQPNRYEIITAQNETKLIITFHETDANVSRWMVRTQKTGWEYPSECLFGQISLNPSPQRIVTDRKAETVTDEGELIIRRTVKENAVLDCIIEPKLDSSFKSKKSLWEYSLNGTSYGRLPAGVRRANRTKLIFENLKKSHQGYYRCSLNNQTLTGVLRVKDPYAALWPFLIIVSTVLVLIVLILLFEKRQKDAKKKAAALANDDANNPLVSPSKKATDYENKKQAQNA